MSWRSNDRHYGAASIALHWLMLLLIALVATLMELHESFPKGSETREALTHWHFMLGLSVLGLVALRLAVNLGAPVPRIEPDPPGWQHKLARATHLALYVLMIGLPITGWLFLSAANKPIPFFGFDMPALIGPSKPIAGAVKEIHEIGAKIGYALVALHAAAALFHHYFVRDNTLRRMLPG
ncbi:MAG: cytochrome b [Burkholderiaceae bacterium]|nr:cytochrome b [Burkholderiaceae bacterium]